MQPAQYDGGTSEDAVAEIAAVIAPKPDAENRAAGAIARLLPGIDVDPTLPGIGKIAGVARQPAPGSRVRMVGRTSGVVIGTVTAVNVNGLQINLGTGTATFSGLIKTTAISQVGDSGAPVVNDRNELVGMVYAGSTDATILIPIESLLSAFEVTLVQ